MQWIRLAVAALAGLVSVQAQVAERLAEAVRAKAADGRFMGSVLVARGDGIVHATSVGYADAEWEVPNTATTRYRIGSITKQFTAAAILLLAERGRLDVDDPLSRHIEGVPEAWRTITLRHLLGHTSGIPDFTALPPYEAWKVSGPSPAMIFARLRELPLDFRPGSQYRYSNSGYVLLGWVIEIVSGRTYREFVRRQLLEPHGLADSGYDSGPAILPRRAAGYVAGARGLRNANYLDMRVPHGAGGLYSTTGDLWQWTRALFGGRVLRPASLDQMIAPGRGGYGLGLQIGEKHGRKRYAHAGGISGFGSFLAYFPASDVTIVVLANVEGPAAAELEEQLEAIYFGD